jgi:hypothetical protein
MSEIRSAEERIAELDKKMEEDEMTGVRSSVPED